MNKHFFKAAIASLGAIGLLTAGGTYALFHDAVTESGNNVGAGTLTMKVDPRTAGHYVFDNVRLVPGGSAEYDFLVVSNSGTSTPNGDLSMHFGNLAGTEDGCDGSLEALADPACSSGPVTANAPSFAGQFPQNAQVVVNVSGQVPASDLSNACTSAYPRGNVVTNKLWSSAFFTSGGAGVSIPLTSNLNPGDGICVGLAILLPSTAGDDTQGDSATFDTTFNLDQHV